MVSIKRLFLVITLLLITGTVSHTDAQTNLPRSAALMRLHRYIDNESMTSIGIYSAETQEYSPLANATGSPAYLDIAPDGTWKAYTVYHEDTKYLDIIYQKMERYQESGEPTLNSFPSNYAVFDVHFSSDSRYLMYSAVDSNLQTGIYNWVITIIDLASGRRLEYADTIEGDMERWVPAPRDYNGKQLYFIRYLPYSDAPPTALAVIDTPTVDRWPLDQQSGDIFETAKEVAEARFFISPDGTKFAYLTFDESNPPTDYHPEPFLYDPKNVLMINRGNGTETLVQAPKGQGIGNVAWSNDSNTLYYTVGSYLKQTWLSAPKLYSLKLDEKTPTDTGIIIPSTPTLMLTGLLVCEDTLYYTLWEETKADTLYSAPLKSPLQAQSFSPGEQSSIQLMGCLPEQPSS